MKVKIKNIPEVGFEPTTSGMGVSCTLPLRHSGGVDPRPFIGRPTETVMGRVLRVACCVLCFRRVAMTSRFYKVGEVKDTGDRVRSYDLRVMSPARFRCATPVKSAAFYVQLTLPPIGIDPMPAF